jgi:hypothetical protein
MLIIYSEFGIDVHVDSEPVRHPCWEGKKADDIYAQQKGLHVIPV